MKKVISKIRFTACWAVLALSTQSFTPPSVKQCFRDPILVPQGTPVMLRLQNELKTDEMEIGNVVFLEVINPVIVEGVEVVTQGTIGEGEITALRRNDDCSDCRDEVQSIEITATKVKAVDGKLIWLYGRPLLIKGKKANAGFTVHQGTRLSATVQNTVRVKV